MDGWMRVWREASEMWVYVAQWRAQLLETDTAVVAV